MSNYNSYVGALASQEEKSTIQKYEGNLGNDPNSKRREILDKELYNYSNISFVNLLFAATFKNIHSYMPGDLPTWFHENENDIVSRFSKLNEDCLSDEAFSQAIKTGKLYTKKIGETTDEVYFRPNAHDISGSIVHEAKLDMFYIPSKDSNSPNIIKLEVKEFLCDRVSSQEGRVPFIKYSVEFGDSGSILTNKPVMVIGQRAGDKIVELVSANCDISSSHIEVDRGNLSKKSGIYIVRDVLMELFEKSGIKETGEKRY